MKRNDLIFCLIAAACIAISYIATDIYLPALPTLRMFFSVNIETIQTTVSIYMIGVVIAQLIIGPVADHYGFRQTIIPLAILLILTSLFCASARSVLMLDIGRLLQALAAGGMAVIGRASFSRYFPPDRAMSLYIAIIPPVAIISPALAPSIGGLLAHHFNWQSIFILLALLSLLVLLGLIFNYPVGKQENVETSLRPSFIVKTYLGLLIHRDLLAFLSITMAIFAVYYAYMIESPFIFHAQGYSVKQIGFSYISIGLAFLLTTQTTRLLLKYFPFMAILNVGFSLTTLGILALLLLSFITRLSMLSILIPVTFYMGAIGFLGPIAMSKSIALFPTKSGYASSLIGSSSLLGAALGAQLVHLITNGSVRNLAILSLVIIIMAWLLFYVLIKPTSAK
mgnify:CR=1 FL=1